VIIPHLLLNSAIIFGTALTVADPAQPKVRTEMLVTTDWLAQHLQDKDVVILCVSNSPGFYAEGHIPGAHWLNLSEIVTKHGDTPNELPSVEQLTKVFRQAGVKRGARIILYGDEYNLLAMRAYYTLDYLDLGGHTSLLDGGLDKWKNERRSVTEEKTEASSSPEFTPHINQRILMDTGNIKDWTSSPQATRAVLLDARPVAEYAGERHSADVHKLGHIPGAQSLYWQELLVSRENPVLLPPDQLRKRFEAAGAAPGRQVITYCRTGIQSSFDYFVAKYLGYDVRMYDASFIEWSNEDLPSETSK
jgi:thiosulfate/3-mercaptopyruvate sulfurtransferase